MNTVSESTPRMESAKNLSVVVIAKDEAARIALCLSSVEFAGELIVADTGSTDDTPRIAEEHGARVLNLPFVGFGPTKQRAIEEAGGEWILSIDADERVTPRLKEAVLDAISTDSPLVGYELPRLTWFLGHPIRHGGWYPNYQLRLFRKGRGRFTPDPVHERVIVDGQVGRLEGDLEHRPDDTFAQHLVKIERYTNLAAKKLADTSIFPIGFWPAMVHAVAAFLRKMVVRSGWRDGIHGALIAGSSAYSVYLKYLKAAIIRRGGGDFLFSSELVVRPTAKHSQSKK